MYFLAPPLSGWMLHRFIHKNDMGGAHGPEFDPPFLQQRYQNNNWTELSYTL